MKKKILLFIALISMLACFFAISISAETPKLYIEFGARFSGSDEYITVYTENAENTGNPRIDFASKKFYSDVDFTQEVDMSTVTGIDFSVTKTYENGVEGKAPTRMVKPSSPFVDCVEVKWFTQENAMEYTIPSTMFKGWSSLKSFDFGNLQKLGDNAFEGCGFETLVIPSTITNLYSKTFALNSKLTSVKFEGATELGGNANAFYQCTALTSVDLGNVPYIGAGTFNGCTALTSIEIPASVSSIKDSAFQGCTALASVTFEDGCQVTTIGAGAFQKVPASNLSIPSTVTSIGSSAFKESGITSVTIPAGVKSISESMFYGCTALTSVDIPSSVTEIMGSAFHSCSSLSSVTMREGITKMGNYAFYKIGAASLHIPASVQSLGYQFAEESGIVSLTFAKNSQLTFIDHRAFNKCTSLEGTVILPDGLIEIDYGLFSGCTKLKAVKMPNSVTTLSGNSALFNGCSSLEYVQFSNQLTSICNSMFENCSSLKAISLPDSVKEIGYKALRKCVNLQAVYLPSGLTNLGKNSGGTATDWGVFYQSPKVYFVNEPFEVFDGDELIENFEMPQKPEVYYMPSGLTVVGNSEFQDCTNLNDYIVFPVGVNSMADCNQGAFYGTGRGRTTPLTLVFLGDMDSIIIRQNDDAYVNIHYVFANPNDVDLNSLTLTIGSANNKYLVNSYMYFCAGNVVYDLTTFKVTNATTHVVQETDFTKTVNTKETQPHFVDPKKTVETDPTCVNNKKEITYCFCGAESGVTEVENTALGHEHSIFLDLVYLDFSQAGYYSYKCERCDDVNNDKSSPALFENQGYSTQQYSNGGIQISFVVNHDAVEEYNTIKKSNIKYGIFAVAQANAQGKEIINANGEGATGVASVDFSKYAYDIFAIRVIGFETDEHRNAQLALGAYVIDNGKVSYLQVGAPAEGNTYCYTSYNAQA